MQLKAYVHITKPGIILGNLFTFCGGFLFASQGKVDYSLLALALLATLLTIASACVFNNYIDRDIDKLMTRTQSRVLICSQLTAKESLIYASVLGCCGLLLFYYQTSLLVTCLAFIGFFIYVAVYSLYLKRNSVHGTLIGSISGALPPVMGYCVVTNQFDIVALLLLLLFCFWQMVHAYAIALVHYSDYQKAGIPVLPVIKGHQSTEKQIRIYLLLFTLTLFLLTLPGYSEYPLLIIMLLLNISGFMIIHKSPLTYVKRAKRLFSFSMVNVLILSLMLSINNQFI